MSKFQEKRQAPRKDFTELPLVFSLVFTEPPSASFPLRLEADNLSLKGLKFQSNWKIPLFTELKLQIFEKNNKSDPLRVSAKVVRVEEVDTGRSEKTYGIAVAFPPLSESEQNFLAIYLPSPNS